MKTRVYTLIILACFFSLRAWAQCNPTFTTSNFGDNYYSFQANQTQLPGYTYAHSWSVGGYNANNYVATLQYQFSSPGTYSVCHYITIQDSGSITVCTDSSCQTITVVPPCIPAFYSNGFVTGGTTCTFTSNIGSYNNLLLVWTFGDGTSVTGVASPSHTYPAYGDYNYCLHVTDTVNHCTDSSCSFIYVDSMGCYAYDNFYVVQPSLNSTTVVIYNNSYTQNGAHVTVNYGDGTTDTATAFNSDTFTHTYPAYGNYDITINDTDIVTQCGGTYWQSFTVDTCSATLASFTATSYYGQPNTAYFWADSVNNYNTPMIWTFGDGTADSTDSYPTHLYATGGTYNVCLTMQIAGCQVPAWCQNVTVSCNLDATFTYQQPNGFTIAYSPSIAGWYPIDSHVVYKWQFGDGSTSNEIYPTHVYNDTGSFNTCLIVTDTIYGCSDTSCVTISSYQWTDTLCGTVFADYNGNGIQDIGEPPMPGILVYIQGYFQGNSTIQATTDANGYYTAILPPDAVNSQVFIGTGFPAGQLYSLPFFTSNAYYFNQGYWGFYTWQFSATNQRQCGFDFGVINGPSLVQGTVYGDDNNDGIHNNYENGIPNQLVDIGGGQSVVSGPDGQYFAYVDTGNYTLKKDPSGYFANTAVLPATIALPVPNYFALDTGNNFGVQVSPNTRDVAVDLIPFTPVIPGMLCSYQAQITNLSNNYETYTDSITADPNLALDPNCFTYSSYNIATNTGSWNYFSVYPFATVAALAPAVYDASVSLVYNQDLYSSAGVTLINATDNNPANNTDTLHQIAVASFDPNYKQANVPGRTSMGYISTSQELKYSIAFQNTGSGDAINIIVKDILDPGFDLKTFRFIGSSYTYCDVHLAGDTAYFRLSGVMLPPESQTATGSIAWVAYSIKPKSTLGGQTPLRNTASVYFDHNAPVTTNTTLHTIDGPSSVQEIYTDGQLTIAPNPFGSQTNITLQNMPGDKYNYAVTDVLGRTVTEGIITNGETKTLYRNSLSAGTYLITFSDDKGIAKRSKIIAQ